MDRVLDLEVIIFSMSCNKLYPLITHIVFLNKYILRVHILIYKLFYLASHMLTIAGRLSNMSVLKSYVWNKHWLKFKYTRIHTITTIFFILFTDCVLNTGFLRPQNENHIKL